MKRIHTKNRLLTPSSGTTYVVAYSAEIEILEVEFKSGKVYHYLNVPLEIWKKFKSVISSGKSAGEFVNYTIKPYFEFLEIR